MIVTSKIYSRICGDVGIVVCVKKAISPIVME